ncbi:MAG: DUF4830 domain-containing protein [Ruminococcus sp.]|uniref:DUF4830 domain-containing protein n=1 Tax=Ruminococcus sp. TaxID=41978 RepID=UPI002873B36A|nr:DUF4830 domain-containing protein [Ruminococcus sp.]MBQ3284685.1 DUF4830 domain-containing protein [Ruminococcus sp.]
MFRSVNLKNTRAAVFCAIGALLLAAVCFFALRPSTPDTVTINGESVSLRVEDEEDAERFLTACGYEKPEFLFENEITVPKHWNETYTRYNELQRQQGFDLAPFKGKPAKEYVYFVADARNATVLVSGNRIIAAHVCSCDGSEMRMIL